MKPGYKALFSIVGLALLAAGTFAVWRWRRPSELPAPTAAVVEPPPAPEPPPPPPPVELTTRAGAATALPASLNALLPDGVCGVLVDAETREVLWDRHGETLTPIASMTKMMTLLLTLEAIHRDPELTSDRRITVSAAAARMGGSQVWLAPGEVFSLEELLIAMLVQSANDAAYAIAETVAPNGNVGSFVAMMNRRARELGMARSRFFNVHGLPEPSPDRDTCSTCRELVVLALALLKYPEVERWCSTVTVPFRPQSEKPLNLLNHNRLLRTCPGVTGLKTGFIRRSGFCVTVTCRRQGRLLIAVVTGFPSKDERERFVEQLLDWGFTQP